MQGGNSSRVPSDELVASYWHPWVNSSNNNKTINREENVLNCIGGFSLLPFCVFSQGHPLLLEGLEGSPQEYKGENIIMQVLFFFFLIIWFILFEYSG